MQANDVLSQMRLSLRCPGFRSAICIVLLSAISGRPFEKDTRICHDSISAVKREVTNFLQKRC